MHPPILSQGTRTRSRSEPHTAVRGEKVHTYASNAMSTQKKWSVSPQAGQAAIASAWRIGTCTLCACACWACWCWVLGSTIQNSNKATIDKKILRGVRGRPNINMWWCVVSWCVVRHGQRCAPCFFAPPHLSASHGPHASSSSSSSPLPRYNMYIPLPPPHSEPHAQKKKRSMFSSSTN